MVALVSSGLPCEWNCPDRMDAANLHEEEPDPTVHLAAYFGSAHLHRRLKVSNGPNLINSFVKSRHQSVID